MPPIPPFTRGGALPPYVGNPVSPSDRSPYVTTLVEVVARFATSARRGDILRGYLDYRAALREVGFVSGYQWLDGSFVECVEETRGKPPNDLDLVTFYHRPSETADDGTWEMALRQSHPEEARKLLEQRAAYGV